MLTAAGPACSPATVASSVAGVDPRSSFAGLGAAPALVLAVSGGPDSMALLALAAEWTAGQGGPRLHAATVDHGLRAEAAAEAVFVATAAARLGVAHVTLPWVGDKPQTRIQERARAARYTLLAAHARQVGATHVLTAHHADDQAETVLMRLGRGSGIRGLGGMRRESALAPGIALVRPLLAHTKAALAAVCLQRGVGFVEDPSNADLSFARVRLRAGMGTAAELGLDRPNLERLARRMRCAEHALDAEANRLEGLLRPERDGNAWRVGAAPLCDAAPEIIRRILERAVERVGGSRQVRLDRLEKVADAVHDALNAGTTHATTIGGTRILVTRDKLLEVTPEPARRRGRARAENGAICP